MDFKIEQTKNGKPFITFKTYKYREGYSVKNGDIIWRCLGRICGASIKTDANKSSISIIKSTHNGPHPITMQSLSSTEQRRKSLGSASSPATEIESSCLGTVVSPPSSLATSAATSPGPLTITSTPITSCLAIPSQQLTTLDELEAENTELKKCIEDLSHQLKCVIDHTIENDARLLHYTNEIFSISSSDNKTPGSVDAMAPQNTSPRFTECSVQCDLVTTHQERNKEDRALIESLKTTIQVLEAEIECLKTEHKQCTCTSDGSWSVYSKKKSLTTEVQNKFQPLDLDNEEMSQRKINKPQEDQNKQNKNKNKKNKKKKIHKGTEPGFKTNKKGHFPDDKSTSTEVMPHKLKGSLLIESDSHGRHLAGMIRDLIGDGPKVTGMCKPGAGLLDVASTKPSTDDFIVLIAGANDIATGRQSIIFQHLERVLVDGTSASRVVVSTVPYRHDLPIWHAVHRDTANVNRFIEETAARHARVKVLDFNKIPRRLFTRHGMHLRMPGKRLLARHILQCLERVATAGPTSSAPPAAVSVTTAAVACQSPAETPQTLPYDSYAEAVKGPQSPSYSLAEGFSAAEVNNFLDIRWSVLPAQ